MPQDGDFYLLGALGDAGGSNGGTPIVGWFIRKNPIKMWD